MCSEALLAAYNSKDLCGLYGEIRNATTHRSQGSVGANVGTGLSSHAMLHSFIGCWLCMVCAIAASPCSAQHGIASPGEHLLGSWGGLCRSLEAVSLQAPSFVPVWPP